METTIDYASDYGGEASDYQTTMVERPATIKRLWWRGQRLSNDYGGKARDGKRLWRESERRKTTIDSVP